MVPALLALLCSGAVLGGAASKCNARFQAPEEPRLATDHNGVALEETCFERQGPHHVFVIGDWGGVDKDGKVEPADDRHGRPFVVGVDDWAQQRVADQMQRRAPISDPDYVLNVGDNFYWGGLTGGCGKPVQDHEDRDGQWGQIFERMYTGPGLDDKQWLGVLGNHDYGGFHFTAGWDQVIGYTWAGLSASTGRWFTPAQHYSAKVVYPGFTVDYFFVDSNVFNAWDAGADAEHNICGEEHNDEGANCGETGPASVGECGPWFQELWDKQMEWLEDGLGSVTSDWQIIVSHFPATAFGTEDWKRLCDKYGIDLFLSGHIHNQEVLGNHEGNPIAPTTHLISGGGGGITTDGTPALDGHDDMYGFFDLTLSKGVITVEAISHGGITRSITEVYEWSVAKKRTTKKPVAPSVPESEASEGPGDVFLAVMPSWAMGGTSWFSLEGGAGASCVKDDEPVVFYGASSVDACRAVCEGLSKCGGMEYNEKRSKCSLWTSDVAATEKDPDALCLSYRKGELNPVVTPQPTLAPTAAPTTDGSAAPDVCVVRMTVHGVDFVKLSQEERLSSAFEAKVREAIIGVLMKAISVTVFPSSIQLQLDQGAEAVQFEPEQGLGRRLGEPGSVFVRALVSPPAGVSLDSLVSALGDNAAAVRDSVVAAVSAMQDVEAVSAGPIDVADVVTEAGSAKTPAPTTTTIPEEPSSRPPPPGKGGDPWRLWTVAVGALVALSGLALTVCSIRGRFFDFDRCRELAASRADEPASPPRRRRREDSPSHDFTTVMATETRPPRRSPRDHRLAGVADPPPPPRSMRKGGQQDALSSSSTQLPGSPELAQTSRFGLW